MGSEQPKTRDGTATRGPDQRRPDRAGRGRVLCRPTRGQFTRAGALRAPKRPRAGAAARTPRSARGFFEVAPSDRRRQDRPRSTPPDLATPTLPPPPPAGRKQIHPRTTATPASRPAARFARRRRTLPAHRSPLGYRWNCRGGTDVAASSGGRCRSIAPPGRPAAQGLIVIGRRLFMRRRLAALVGRLQRQLGHRSRTSTARSPRCSSGPSSCSANIRVNTELCARIASAQPIQRGLADPRQE